LSQSVTDKRTALYNKLVASYHKAKGDRADMARELEVAQGETSFSRDLLFSLFQPADGFGFAGLQLPLPEFHSWRRIFPPPRIVR
jgi:hypothetical protein